MAAQGQGGDDGDADRDGGRVHGGLGGRGNVGALPRVAHLLQALPGRTGQGATLTQEDGAGLAALLRRRSGEEARGDVQRFKGCAVGGRCERWRGRRGGEPGG